MSRSESLRILFASMIAGYSMGLLIGLTMYLGFGYGLAALVTSWFGGGLLTVMACGLWCALRRVDLNLPETSDSFTAGGSQG